MPDQPRVVQPVQPPPQTALSNPPSAPLSSGGAQSADREWQLARDLERQEAAAQDLKTQLERQQTQTDSLKAEVDKQRAETDKLIIQLEQQVREQQRLIDNMSLQQQLSSADQNRSVEQLRLAEQSRAVSTADQPMRMQTTILWVVGITILVLAVGGGIILILLIVLLTQSQRRYPRPMHVIHPIGPTYPLPEQAMLPPARSPRRTAQVEYFED